MMIPPVKNIIMWAMTYRCNMSCKYCFLRNKVRRWDELTDEECLALAEKIARDTSWKPDAVWLTGGEPTVKPCLPEIIRIFESKGIRCVVTTNGLCCDRYLSDLLSARPRGINVSLESDDDRVNSESRGRTADVIAAIKKIAEQKSTDTILGVSSVISPKNIDAVSDWAKRLRQLGVDYLSLNPLMGEGCTYTAEDFASIKRFRDAITASGGLKLPNEFYFELIEDYFLSKHQIRIPCPAGKQFMFIAPWGDVYPCSNEMWQASEGIDARTLPCLSDVFAPLVCKFHTDALTTVSPCFGERCIGCWKLYYDSVFTT